MLLDEILPIEILLSEKDVLNVIKMNDKPPFAKRNKALVLGAVGWFLTPFEQTELTVKTVMNSDGTWKKEIELPKSITHNGIERTVVTGKPIELCMQQYVDWLKANNINESGLHSYQGLDPESALFVSDKYEKYALSPRKKGEAGTQPIALNNKLNNLLETAGVEGGKAMTLRDSGIKIAYDKGAKVRDLLAVTGIRTLTSLMSRIRHSESEIAAVMNKTFRGVK